MQNSEATQRFSYDAQGKVVLVNYNGTEYYYLRNAQGDIVKLIDGNCNTVVEYTYDSWGKILAVTGSLATSLGANQPFRYREYIYDTETQWYYLQSRYYDPNTCRFISSDVLLSTGQGVLGHNSYAYCLNNPVNSFDENGEWSLPNWAKIAIGFGAIVVGVAATVATGGLAAPAICATVGAAVKTAVVVGAISAGTRVAKTAVESTIKGDSFNASVKKAVNAAVDGFCDGFMTGGIMVGASMTYGSLLQKANGIKIGTTAKPQYGKVNIGYGNPATNGNTLISIQNNAGKSVFRLDADAKNMLHMHYGSTKKAMRIHRTGLIRAILGVIVGAK